MSRALLVFGCLLWPATLFAETDPPAEEQADAQPEEAAEDEPPEKKSLEEVVEDLEDKVYALEEKLKAQEKPPPGEVVVEVGGYVDFGFFVPQSNGAGFVQDYGNALFPRFAGQYAWVFLGDILAPTVNSRGEAADLGDVPGVDRFDSINSRGAPGFLLSEANLNVKVGLHHAAILTTSINFVPRTGSDFAIGDFFELDVAQLEWVVFGSPPTSIFIGKIEPVFGIEYKQRRADQRFGITPSLAQRYTSGTQLGIKARSKLFDEYLILSAAVTNGNSTTEQFHFHDEVDSNAGKTVSGRVGFRLPFDDLIPALGGALELGVSGEFGPQDRARDNEGDIWFIGADLEYARHDFALRAEWLKGRADGRPIDDVFGLDLRSTGYVELNWMFIPELGVILRGDLRSALVTLGTERAYLTRSWRVTVGARAVISSHLMLKAEYLRNGEYGGIPDIKNDIFTSSLLVTY
jgi:hypothetical protein